MSDAERAARIDLSAIIVKAMNNPDRVYEPEERLHDIKTHHRHRFPIKGGITWRDVMERNVMKHNALYRSLKSKA